MTDLKLKTTLPAMTFDFDGLMAMAKGIKEKYANLVVREEDVSDIKKVMADLNKTKKAVDDARKEAVKKVSEPICDFESRIKEVISVISETRQVLDEQVKAHIERERKDKERDVQFLIDDLKDEHDVPDLGIQIEPSWLTKSKKLQAIKAEVEAIILAHLKAEKEAAQLEQAKQDRALAIEQRCEVCAKEYGVTLPPSIFIRLNNLEISLADVNEQIDNAFKMKALTHPVHQQAQEPASTPVAEPVQQTSPTIPPAPKPPVAPVAPTINTKRVYVEVEYTPENEKAVEAALRELQKYCVSARLTNDARFAA